MQQLVRYITLLYCVTTAQQALEELHNDNRVVFFDEGNSIVFLDGDWWGDFCGSHRLDICATILLYIRTRFKANHIHLKYRNVPIACFTWNDDVKMYLGKNCDYHKVKNSVERLAIK